MYFYFISNFVSAIVFIVKSLKDLMRKVVKVKTVNSLSGILAEDYSVKDPNSQISNLSYRPLQSGQAVKLTCRYNAM